MVYFDRPAKLAPDIEERIIGAVRELMPKEFLAGPIAYHLRRRQPWPIPATRSCLSSVTPRATFDDCLKAVVSSCGSMPCHGIFDFTQRR